MKTLKDYIFVDCVLMDFYVDKLISTVIIVTESYYPMYNGKRQKGTIKLSLKNIMNFTMSKLIEFDFDIQSNYGKDKYNDTIANEVYHIKDTVTENNTHNIELDSDFLKLTVICGQIEIEEIR